MQTATKKVLIVDDEEDILGVVAFTLEGEGYQVETASNGQEGLEAIARAMPDLIILDMKMPIMNGWEFAAEFHRRYDHQAPILIITAAEDARKRAEEVGAQGWIGKPFDLDYLTQAVEERLKAR